MLTSGRCTGRGSSAGRGSSTGHGSSLDHGSSVGRGNDNDESGTIFNGRSLPGHGAGSVHGSTKRYIFGPEGGMGCAIGGGFHRPVVFGKMIRAL